MLRMMILLIVMCSSVLPAWPQTVARYAIVIDELFPDPSPSIGLPAAEFIELKNVSKERIDVRNWRLTDGSSTAIIQTSFILFPDSFVIVCPNSAVSSFTAFGSVIGLSNFPSLNNDADIISLLDPQQFLIHSVGYEMKWYKNSIKSDGGWSLEMIDPLNPCAGIDNWRASEHARGGTPGRLNSINGSNKDEQYPAIIRTYMTDSTTAVAVFDESLDSASASIPLAYSINPAAGKILTARAVTPLFNHVELKWEQPLAPDQIYQLSVTSVRDCAGNNIGGVNTATLARPKPAGKLDLVINEILFNPPPDGSDYIELYNRSSHTLDCQQLFIANRSSTGTITNSTPLSAAPFLLFPGEYLLLCGNREWLQRNYVVKSPSQILSLPALPSMPDDKGTIVLLNHEGKVIDELSYDQQWHFPLLREKEGVALERINYSENTQLKSNWSSASSSSGFGTPTYQNSQFAGMGIMNEQIVVRPKIFSPNNDGIDDFVSIYFQMAEPGYMASIYVYDANGRKRRTIVNNQSISVNATFRWDGLDEQQKKAAHGCYIIVVEIFNLSGKTSRVKLPVVIGP